MLAGVPAISQIAQGLSNLTLVSPLLSPQYGPIDIDGNSLGKALVFDYEGENTIKLQSDITDHFIESNSTVQDNIALRPEKITVHGFKGEVSNLFPGFLPPATQVFAVLGAVGAFAPEFSQSAMNIINEANQAYQATNNAINGAVTAWNTITGDNGNTVITSGGISAVGANQNKQQLLFAQWYGYWRSRALFNVQTPWALFTPCAIEDLTPVQDEKTQELTDFFITFKMMRFVTTQKLNGPQAGGRAINQYSPTTQNGNASLKTVPGLTDQLTSFGLGN